MYTASFDGLFFAGNVEEIMMRNKVKNKDGCNFYYSLQPFYQLNLPKRLSGDRADPFPTKNKINKKNKISGGVFLNS